MTPQLPESWCVCRWFDQLKTPCWRANRKRIQERLVVDFRRKRWEWVTANLCGVLPFAFLTKTDASVDGRSEPPKSLRERPCVSRKVMDPISRATRQSGVEVCLCPMLLPGANGRRPHHTSNQWPRRTDLWKEPRGERGIAPCGLYRLVAKAPTNVPDHVLTEIGKVRRRSDAKRSDKWEPVKPIYRGGRGRPVITLRS